MSQNNREIFNAIRDVSHGIPMSAYNETRKDNLTSGNLKVAVDEGLAVYDHQMRNPKVFDTHAMKEGRALHTLTLEGEGVFSEEYVLGDDVPINNTKAGNGNPYGPTSQAYLSWANEKQIDGKTLLSIPENNKIVTMRDAILENPKMAHIFSEGIAERTIYADYCGISCQIRPDWINPVYGMMDLKKTASLKWFLRDAKWKYKYIHAAAFYRSVTRVALSMEYEDLPFCLLAVQSEEPYITGVFELDPEMLDFCEKENALVIDEIKEARDTGIWKSGYEGVTYVDQL